MLLFTIMLLLFASFQCLNVKIVSPLSGSLVGGMWRVVLLMHRSNTVGNVTLFVDFDDVSYDISESHLPTSEVDGTLMTTFAVNDAGYGKHTLKFRAYDNSIGGAVSCVSDTLSVAVRVPENKILSATFGNLAEYSVDVTARVALLFTDDISDDSLFLVNHASLGLPPPNLSYESSSLFLLVMYDSKIVRGYTCNSTISLIELFMGFSSNSYPTVTSPHLTNRFHYLLAGLTGIEIGGPSYSQYVTGLYESPAVLDGVNYATETLWSRNSRSGGDYAPFGRVLGKQYITDVTELDGIVPSNFKENLMCLDNGHCLPNSDSSSSRYDFLFASHVLEHVVNPLRALEQMTRLLKPGGLIILILPWKQETFDHLRPDTQFETLLEFYHTHRNESYVDDLLPDIVRDYDLSRDPPAGNMDQFIERSLHHAENKALHVHVFNFELIVHCLEFFHFEILDVQLVAPFDQTVVGRLQV